MLTDVKENKPVENRLVTTFYKENNISLFLYFFISLFLYFRLRLLSRTVLNNQSSPAQSVPTAFSFFSRFAFSISREYPLLAMSSLELCQRWTYCFLYFFISLFLYFFILTDNMAACNPCS